MIEGLNTVLPIIIYFLLIILIIVVIVLGIKFIITLDRVNAIITDVENKIASLNSLFTFADRLSDNFGKLGIRIIDRVTATVSKILGVRSGKDDDDDYE